MKIQKISAQLSRAFIATTSILLIEGFLPTTAKAESSIEPISQTFFATDFDIVGGLSLKRIYSSATVFRGNFGAGWCSELDAEILQYAAGEIRFRSCDLETAQLIDVRGNAAGVRRTATGFRREREDGAVLYFNQNGRLEKLVRPDGELRLQRDVQQRLLAILVRLQKRETLLHVDLQSSNTSVESSLITAIGDGVRFSYLDGMMVKSNSEAYQYDRLANMTRRTDGRVTEAIKYDEGQDRVVRLERTSAFEPGRLLVAIERRGKSEQMEIRAEVIRGAEMRPVFILYDRKTQRLSLQGDRDIAMLIVEWMRA